MVTVSWRWFWELEACWLVDCLTFMNVNFSKQGGHEFRAAAFGSSSPSPRPLLCRPLRNAVQLALPRRSCSHGMGQGQGETLRSSVLCAL